MLGAFIMSLHGYRARLMDLRSCAEDDDHVVALFQRNGLWGCLSVSNRESLHVLGQHVRISEVSLSGVVMFRTCMAAAWPSLRMRDSNAS